MICIERLPAEKFNTKLNPTCSVQRRLINLLELHTISYPAGRSDLGLNLSSLQPKSGVTGSTNA